MGLGTILGFLCTSIDFEGRNTQKTVLYDLQDTWGEGEKGSANYNDVIFPYIDMCLII